MPSDNRNILSQLFDEGKINIKRGAIFDASPKPMPDDLDFDRIEGMLLGLAVGDALGNTAEGMRAGQRAKPCGEIRDYLPNRHAGLKEVGLPTDDTQPAFWDFQTVPAVIYILTKHGHDFEKAIVRAVNDTKDNDTIAAIVGAALGALHGRKNIPARWLESLPGRTTADDDGKIFDFLEQAGKVWG